MELTTQQRESILAKIQSLVAEKYFDPAFDHSGWQAIVRRNRPAIVDASSTADFESAIGKMLAELSPKTLGLLSDHTPITPRNAINASFSVQTVASKFRWVFQDVLPGGIAARAGVRPGDVLLMAAGKPMQPLNELLRTHIRNAAEHLMLCLVGIRRARANSFLARPHPNTRTIRIPNPPRSRWGRKLATPHTLGSVSSPERSESTSRTKLIPSSVADSQRPIASSSTLEEIPEAASVD